MAYSDKIIHEFTTIDLTVSWANYKPIFQFNAAVQFAISELIIPRSITDLNISVVSKQNSLLR